MTQQKLNAINTVTNELHDYVASINEELVDNNHQEVQKLITKLIQTAKHIKTNIHNYGIH